MLSFVIKLQDIHDTVSTTIVIVYGTADYTIVESIAGLKARHRWVRLGSMGRDPYSSDRFGEIAEPLMVARPGTVSQKLGHLKLTRIYSLHLTWY